MKGTHDAICRLRAMADSTDPSSASDRHSHDPVFQALSAPYEHFVHLYQDDASLMPLLHRYVGDGLRAGDAAVVIATPDHLASIDRTLVAEGIDLVAARWQGQYLPMDARATLRQFMVSTGPDPVAFEQVMTDVLRRARRNGRRVRAFGEMVALLWADGLQAPTLALEHLWDDFCHRESMGLFCAYPESSFDDTNADALAKIRRAHSR